MKEVREITNNTKVLIFLNRRSRKAQPLLSFRVRMVTTCISNDGRKLTGGCDLAHHLWCGTNGAVTRVSLCVCIIGSSATVVAGYNLAPKRKTILPETQPPWASSLMLWLFRSQHRAMSSLSWSSRTAWWITGSRSPSWTLRSTTPSSPPLCRRGQPWWTRWYAWSRSTMGWLPEKTDVICWSWDTACWRPCPCVWKSWYWRVTNLVKTNSLAWSSTGWGRGCHDNENIRFCDFFIIK